MQSKATTVAKYLEELPADRRAALTTVRNLILKNLDKDYEEGMQYGMIGYYVPHRIFPAGYHCDPKQPLPFAGLASQKNHMSLYMMSAYGDGGDHDWIRSQFEKAGKKLDMGKCCIRFKRLEELPLDVIAEAFRRVPAKRYIDHYQAAILTHNKKAAIKAGKYSSSEKPKTAKNVKTVKKPAAAKKPTKSRKQK